MPRSDLQLDFCQNTLTDEFQGDGGENEDGKSSKLNIDAALHVCFSLGGNLMAGDLACRL